jgi:multiple antibiotic resistance protein
MEQGLVIPQGTVQHYLLGLLAIGNNVSALGAFLAHSRGLPRAKVRRIILITSGACLAMLLLFLLMGPAILGFFGISISSFQIAGGLLLGGLGLDMMKSRHADDVDIKAVAAGTETADAGNDAHLYGFAVVPIALPLTVGAGTFSAVILFSDQAQRSGTIPALVAAIGALVGVNFMVFIFSARIVRVVGDVGLSVFAKVMGLFTLAIGVEFILRGLTTVYHELSLAAPMG